MNIAKNIAIIAITVSTALNAHADYDGDYHGAYLPNQDWHTEYNRYHNLNNLRGADLSGSDLRDTKFSKADLSGANLRNTDLRNAYFGDADLGSANLSGADLRGAYFGGADLFWADLSGADLRGVDLSGVYLSTTNLTGAIVDENTKGIEKDQLSKCIQK